MFLQIRGDLYLLFHYIKMIASGPGQDLGTQFVTWVKNIPAHTQVVLFFATITYAMSLFSLPIDNLFVNDSQKVLEGLQFWRIFTCAYVVCYLVTYVFMLLIYIPSACYRERDIGTVRYFVYFLLNNLFGQFIFIGLDYLFYVYLIPGYQGTTEYIPQFQYASGGLWVIMMSDMVIRNYQDPERPVNFMCCPLQLRAKFTHWCFFTTLSIIFLKIRFDLLAGIIIGHLHIWKLMAWTVISKDAGERAENFVVFRCFSKLKNYIETSESGLDMIEFDAAGNQTPKSGYVPPDMELNSTISSFKSSPSN